MNKFYAFIAAFFIAAIGYLITLNFFGFLSSVGFSVFTILLLFISRPIWLPDGYGKNKVRLVSLTLGLGAIGFTEPIWRLIKANWPALQTHLPFKLDIPPDLGDVSIIQMAFIGLIVWIVNYYMSEGFILSSKNLPFDADFPVKTYTQKLEKVAIALQGIIKQIDNDLNWSAEYFTPLEAEVEIIGSSRKEITTLLDSIKKDKKSRKFLIIGDPGSGKSVSLRKLALEMLKEAPDTGKLPLYINLKEWSVDSKWSNSNPPTSEDLKKFIVNKISQKDIFVHDFFEDFFDKMFEHGRLFFIFDSFDEIPRVIDEDESSWLIDELSRLFSQFIGGAHESRGVLSSRQFRKPTNSFFPDKILEVRPFTDVQIRDALTANKSQSSFDLVKILFMERPDWISIARNPFNASLLADYFKRYQKLPNSQSDLFESYLQLRLDKSSVKENASKLDYTTQEMLDFATTVAYQIYKDPNLGLEISQKNLSIKLGFDTTPLINVLKFSLIVRVSDDWDTVSFVHRRFTEYFISRYLIANPLSLDLQSIPSDSSGRDGLIMYCEVAPLDKAQEIANFCWETIKRNKNALPQDNPESYREVILCVRFLSQAFRSRVECINSFRQELNQWVTEKASSSLLECKHTLEISGLLNQGKLEQVVVYALMRENYWLTDSAINACRHLGSVDEDLEVALISEIHRMTPSQLLSQSNQLNFSLGLSQAFKRVRSFTRLKIINIKCVGLVSLGICMFLPLMIPFYLLIGSYRYSKNLSNLSFITNSFFTRKITFLILEVVALLVASKVDLISFQKYGFISLIPKEQDACRWSLLLLAFLIMLPVYILPIYKLGIKKLCDINIKEAILLNTLFSFKSLRLLVRNFIFIAIGSALTYWLERYIPESVKRYVSHYGLYFLMLLMLFLILHSLRIVAEHFWSVKKIRDLIIKKKMNREDVQILFKKFKPTTHKQLFERLKAEVDEIYGAWNTADLDDDIKTFLAQLDEKWMRLN